MASSSNPKKKKKETRSPSYLNSNPNKSEAVICFDSHRSWAPDADADLKCGRKETDAFKGQS